MSIYNTEEFEVVIEIPMGEGSVKYEIDHASGMLKVDRFSPVSMNYPYNYGYIPDTIAGDGDPCDALVIVHASLYPKSVVTCRPIGVLHMEDDGGIDKKIICLPQKKIDLFYADVESIHELPKVILSKIKHFFSYYKKLEKDKWVKIGDWGNKDEAKKIVQESFQNFDNKS